MNKYISFLVELVSGILVGLLFGVAFDEWFGTGYIFTILFVIIGFFAGIKNIKKYIK